MSVLLPFQQKEKSSTLNVPIVHNQTTTKLRFVFLFCSGKIVSPKWKSFKGLRLLWRDKIRLNNAIWRAWFIQCESTTLSAAYIFSNISPLMMMRDITAKCS